MNNWPFFQKIMQILKEVPPNGYILSVTMKKCPLVYNAMNKYLATNKSYIHSLMLA